MGCPHRSRRWILAVVCLAATIALGSRAIDLSRQGEKSTEGSKAPAPGVSNAVLPVREAPPATPVPVQAKSPECEEQIVPVGHFGRYVLKLASAQGAALQLVDRMGGPGPVDGIVGQRDGRLDVFLGPGEYKVVKTFAHGTQAPALTVLPFEEVNGDKAPQLIERTLVEADLSDAQQRSYWMVVSSRQTVFIEAAGRYLNDLRLWKDGNWLIPAEPSSERSEPNPGQPLAVKRLVADLEPGLYRLTAYGGPGVPWTQAGTGKPFVLRWGIPSLPETGRRRVVASPFGFDRWLVGGAATYFRLELPRGETGSLVVGDYDNGQFYGASSAGIDKNSREPSGELYRQPRKGKHMVTVRTRAGQTYVLQNYPARQEYSFRITADAQFLVAALRPGLGEDDPDLTVLLSEISVGAADGKLAEKVIAGQTIRLGSATPWRRRFNLMGQSSLLLKVADPGRYQVEATGVQTDVQLQPIHGRDVFDDTMPPQLNGGTWALDAGFYRLILTPRPGGSGIVSLSLHGEGTPEAAEAAPPMPSRAVFVPVTVHPKTLYTLRGNQPTGFLVRPLPADLDEDLPLLLPPNDRNGLSLTVTFPQDGSLQALTDDGQALPLVLDLAEASDKPSGQAGRHSVHIINSTPTPLAVSLHFTPETKTDAVPALPALSDADARKSPDLPVLAAGQPRFLDLDARQSATFQVKVDAPALYRVETTGLLETSGTMRTQVRPSLTTATANGVGRNMLLQQYLREGIYLLTVATQGRTKGHLGLSLTKAPVRQGGPISPGIPAHALMASGEGIAYDLDVVRAGTYRLRVLVPDTSATAAIPARHSENEEDEGDNDEQAREQQAGASTGAPLIRLEDTAGWPLTTPDQTGDTEKVLAPGRYRLIIQPPSMPSRVLAFVEEEHKPDTVSGHGPHPLVLGTTASNTWEEPAQGQTRTPDRWSIALPAEADLSISLSEGMRADLIAENDGKTTASLSFREPWHGRLPAGGYRLEATSVRPNNRLDYTVSTSVEQLVAGMSRTVVAPARIPVTLGGDHRVELTSFGSGQVEATLLDARERVVAKSEARADDWNINLATRLPAGQYVLKLDPVGQPQAKTEVRLRELAEAEEAPMAAGQDRQWSDGILHSQILTFDAKDGPLIVAAARSRDAVGLALERRAANGAWTTMASASGAEAVLALPRDTTASKEDYRLQVWPRAGSRAAVTLSMRCPSPVPVGERDLASGLSLRPLPGIEPPLGTATVNISTPGLIRLDKPASSLIWGDGGEHRALAHGTEVAAVGAGPLWFIGPIDSEAVQGERVTPTADAPLNLSLAAAQTVTLPLPDDGKGPQLWLADSRVGQPGLAIAMAKERADLRVSGLAAGGSAALLPDSGAGAGKTIRLWRSDGDDAMPVSLSRLNFPRPDHDSQDWGEGNRTLDADTALELALPEGAKHLLMALPARMAAALIDKNGGVHRLLWTGTGPEPFALDSDASRLLLLNAGSQPGRLSLTVMPAASGLTMAPGAILRQPQASAGLLQVEVDTAGRAMSLVFSGPVTEAWVVGRNGTIRRGRDTLSVTGEATLLLRHEPGLLAAWLTDGGSPSWLEAAGTAPVQKAAPATLPLSGAETAWRFAPDQPALLHLRVAQPVLAATSNDERSIWPEGADLQLFLPAGRNTLVGLRPLQEATLSGLARLSFSPAQPLGEGLGPKLRLAPGDARLFTFTLSEAGAVGVGIKGEADSARMRLYDESGALRVHGAVALSDLAAGRYFLVVENRADANATEVQPALVGLVKPGKAPPEEVKRKYWDMVTVEEGK